MGTPEGLLNIALDKVRKIKNLDGEFLVGKTYEQGVLNIQRCTVFSLYFRSRGKNVLIYRWRACTTGPNMDEPFDEAYTDMLSYLILNWDEVWNLINSKLQ